MIMSLIDLKNINFSYQKSKAGTPDFFLESINLSVESGEFISILGPNGSGKSTLLKLISGVLKPLSGDISLKSTSYGRISKRDLARTIAFVPQSALSVFPFSIFEIVMMGRTPYLNMVGYENHSDIDLVNEALEMVDIAHLRNKGINEVSGGEAQRAFIARAIVQQPEVILLDEPNAHLDIKHQLSIFDLIRELNIKKNLTVITVSHDLNLAGFYSKRIVLMKQGRIFKDDKAEKILTRENIHSVFDVDSSIVKNAGSALINVLIKPAHLQ
ncbi:MAG: ABC transporter ATP-binding protein [Bacillota bacterium]